MIADIFTELGGNFITPPSLLTQKIRAVRAFIFDWDGVFNDGAKNEQGSSNFSEVDSMGTNLLRFGWWQMNRQMPIAAVISGERNLLSFQLVQREHYQAGYFRIKHKIEALQHFMAAHHLQPHEVAFFFDDALDLSIAEVCGVRILIKHRGSPLFEKYVTERGLADYVTAHEGGHHAVREGCELLLGLTGIYDQTILNRHLFRPHYDLYLKERQSLESAFFTIENGLISPVIL